jgi:alcohol dehydrogenase class IV
MEPFTWPDGERTIRFGRQTATTFGALAGPGHVVVSTPRARSQFAEIEAGAEASFDVADAPVDEAAAALLDAVRATSGTLVALGGGRVIDAAKALGAATGRRVAAIPTTLSAAEMTGLHRPVKGIAPPPSPVRPAIVINDPALSASQPPVALAASAANALAHAVEATLTTRTSPVPALAGREAARLIALAYAGEEPDREALALGSLLSGYAIDAASFGLHHVLAQTLRATGRVWHGHANAALLPHTMRALGGRGFALPAAPELAERLAAAAGASSLRALGVDDALIDACADAALRRPELAHTPPPAGRSELRALYAAAL